MDNNKTATLRMSETIKTPDGSYDLQFRVSVRSGATAEMIAETVSHFIAMAQTAAEGELTIKAPGWTERRELDLSEHGQNRVVIFGDIKVYTASGLKLFPVNVFSETTAAQDFIDFVWMVMGGIGQVVKLPGSIKFLGNARQAPKPKSELDNHFPRDENGKPVDTSNTPAAPQQRNDYQAAPPEVVDLVNYDYNQQAQYEADHIGRTVCFNVSQVSRDMEVKKNKSATYECLNLWGYWDGLPSDSHPMYSFRMFAPKPEQKYGDWLTFFKTIETGELSEAGMSIARPMRFYYKLANGKGDNANKVYWNLRKWEFLTAEVMPTPQTAAEPPAQGVENKQDDGECQDNQQRRREYHQDTPEDYGISEGDNVPF